MGHHGAQGADGQMSVADAPQARRCATAEPTRWVGGNTQLFSPPHDKDRASTHSASGWKNSEQKRPAFGGQSGWQLPADANRSMVCGPQSPSRYANHSS